jgi:hypothetical protein
MRLATVAFPWLFRVTFALFSLLLVLQFLLLRRLSGQHASAWQDWRRTHGTGSKPLRQFLRSREYRRFNDSQLDRLAAWTVWGLRSLYAVFFLAVAVAAGDWLRS